MRKIYKRKKSQSTLEYAVLIAIVAIALLTMQIYFKRGVQGKIRATSDDIGEQFSTAGTLRVWTNSYSNTSETVGIRGAGVTRSELKEVEYMNRQENLDLQRYNQEWMGRTQ